MRRIGFPLARSLPVLLAFASGGCNPGLKATITQQVKLAGAQITLGSNKTCNDPDGYVCAGDHGDHPVIVSDFTMDRTEVTVLQYAACIVAGACLQTASTQFQNGSDFQDSTKNQPVQVNDPDAAAEYCRWLSSQAGAAAGLRLPTEAEFEYAARLGADGALHDYPWGDTAPTCDQVTYGNCRDATIHDVGSSVTDTTAAGVKDLAGSVPEWVEDSYVPFASCADRLGYADLCDGEAASCPETRCLADGSNCLTGCLIDVASLDSVRSGSQTTTMPLCPLDPMGTRALQDPVLRTSSQFAVVRGAGPIDRACDLAGYTRRHAQPGGAYYAGFRCVASTIQPAAPVSYRFSLDNCPAPDYQVRLSVTTVDGKAAAYTLEEFPAVPAPLIPHSPFEGVVERLQCASTFVIRPLAPTTLSIVVGDYVGCATWTGQANLINGGDVPASGKVGLLLGPSTTSGGAPDLGASVCTIAHATAACIGQCSLTCNAGYADCDGLFADGCEADTATDSANCGACGKACGNAANGLLGCFGGTCEVKTCNGNWADCNMNPGDGCEINRDTDPNNCGGCRVVCSDNNITHPLCGGGVCDGVCDPGYADCDGNKLLNGCEANLQNDSLHCGNCMNACTAGQTCRNGACM